MQDIGENCVQLEAFITNNKETTNFDKAIELLGERIGIFLAKLHFGVCDEPINLAASSFLDTVLYSKIEEWTKAADLKCSEEVRYEIMEFF